MLVSPYPKPLVTPPGEHPRLMLRAHDLPRITENLKRAENAVAVSVLDELCSCPIRGEGATPEYGSYHLAEVLAAEALAFRALLSGGESDARKAIDAIDLLLTRFTVKDGIMGARWGGHLIFVCSEVYDWCYPFLSVATKAKWIARCEEIAASYFEMGYPPAKQAALSGHGTEAQLLRDLLAFSIAVYDERPDVYDFCAGRIFAEYVPQVRSYLANGAHSQGPAYGSYRWTWLAWSELLLETLSGSAVFGCLESTADWFFYMTRPDGEALRLGDDFNETKAEYNRRAPFTVPFFFAYALTGRSDFYDAFRSGFCREFLLPKHHGMDFYAESSWGEGALSPVGLLIFDRRHGLRNVDPLPACRYFGSPVGETVFRSDDTHVFMKIGEFWGANHDHLDTGCFQLFCGAPLLSDSGVYDSYSTPHRRQYLIRTSAHNCITVGTDDRPLSGEWAPEIRYDGGTRRPAAGKEPKTLEVARSDEYRMAHVLSHRESDDGCELIGDLTPAYRHTCEKVIRKMSYCHPTRTFTVEDEIVSFDPNARKAVHLHCQTPPVVRGNTVIFENGGNRAVCEILSPQKVRIESIGGEGHQFEVDGENFPPKPPYTAEAGWGQVIISAADPTEKTVFQMEIKIIPSHKKEKAK